MPLRVFQDKFSPIAIDFGTASVKLLQLGPGEKPEILAAAEIAIPENARGDRDQTHAYLDEVVPGVLTKGGFRGKKAVISVPSPRTLVQHLALAPVEGTTMDQIVRTQLATQYGGTPDGFVCRVHEVEGAAREGQNLKELLCFAAARDTVIRFVEMLGKAKFEVVGVLDGMQAAVQAFDHVNQRRDDHRITNLYVDLGFGGTGFAIAHGPDLVFARHVPIGGMQLDKKIARTLSLDVQNARTQRIGLGGTPRRRSAEAGPEGQAILNQAAKAAAADATGGTATATERRSRADAPTTALLPADDPPDEEIERLGANEIIDALQEELAMSLRYHAARFPGRRVDRAIVVGGEARQTWLTRRVLQRARLVAQLGDPLARCRKAKGASISGFDLDDPQPGWAVACGLCHAPANQ